MEKPCKSNPVTKITESSKLSWRVDWVYAVLISQRSSNRNNYFGRNQLQKKPCNKATILKENEQSSQIWTLQRGAAGWNPVKGFIVEELAVFQTQGLQSLANFSDEPKRSTHEMNRWEIAQKIPINPRESFIKIKSRSPKNQLTIQLWTSSRNSSNKLDGWYEMNSWI